MQSITAANHTIGPFASEIRILPMPQLVFRPSLRKFHTCWSLRRLRRTGYTTRVVHSCTCEGHTVAPTYRPRCICDCAYARTARVPCLRPDLAYLLARCEPCSMLDDVPLKTFLVALSRSVVKSRYIERAHAPSILPRRPRMRA